MVATQSCLQQASESYNEVAPKGYILMISSHSILFLSKVFLFQEKIFPIKVYSYSLNGPHFI